MFEFDGNDHNQLVKILIGTNVWTCLDLGREQEKNERDVKRNFCVLAFGIIALALNQLLSAELLVFLPPSF